MDWLTPEETSFLEHTLRDHKLSEYLYTSNDVRLRYPHKFEGSYHEFLRSSTEEFQKAHQTLRRLMNKSPYILAQGQNAYTVIHDKSIPIQNLEVGSRIALGYRILMSKPRYDIGKHKSLIELVFPYPVRVLPIDDKFIMDEDHVFLLTGFERIALKEHPSHGTPYHIDVYRLVSTPDVKIPDSSIEIDRRIHVMLDKDEKPNLVISSANWTDSSPASQIMQQSHGDNEPQSIEEKDFEKFKRTLGTLTTRFSAETLGILYRVSTRKKNLITKILFSIHTHVLKLSHVIVNFRSVKPTDTRFSDLESRILEVSTNIEKDLDGYFKNEASLTSSPTTLYTVISAKHMDKLEDKIGVFVVFNNFLVCYNSTDSITDDKLAQKPDSVILVIHIPPKMPVLILPEHTGLSKYHMAVILPRQTMFQLEKISSLKISKDPQATYRKLYELRYNNKSSPPSSMPVDYLLQIEPDMLSSVARDVPPPSHGI